MGFKEILRDFRGFQGILKNFKRSKDILRDFKGFQGNTRNFK